MKTEPHSMRRTIRIVAITLCAATAAVTWAVPASHASPNSGGAHSRYANGLIAYVSDRDSASAEQVIDEVYVMEPRTRRVFRMTEDPAVEEWPTLSSDGRHLAWVRLPVDADGTPRLDQAQLWTCAIRYRKGAWSCLSPRQLVSLITPNSIAFSADGRSLYFSGAPGSDGDVDVFAVRLRGHRAPVNLTEEGPNEAAGFDNQPSASPDGRYLVFSRGILRIGADLFRQRVDGSGRVQLTNAPLNDVGADYSPDGNRLLFHSNRDGDFDVYWMRPEPENASNPAINLTDGLRSGADVTQERRPSWSPDGRQIAFWWHFTPSGFEDGEIYVMRADGSNPRNLTDNNVPSDASPRPIGDIMPNWGGPARRAS